MNLRTTLNNLIANRFRVDADSPNSVGLANLKQIYEVAVDGQTFEVVLSQDEILNNIDGQSPPHGTAKIICVCLCTVYFNVLMQYKQVKIQITVPQLLLIIITW